jgi:uncharacterized membrane protein YfcA
MQDTLALMPMWAFVAAFFVTFAAGFVKGSVGFGMPLVIISGLGLFLEPMLVVAAIVLPIVTSNLQQVSRYGFVEAKSALAEHWRYVSLVCVMILIVAQFVPHIPAQTMYLVLGSVVVILSLVQLVGIRLHIPPSHRRLAEWSVGALAGVVGGLTGTWGPPTVLYLIALDTPKARQMVVQGVVYGLGSISLLAAHLHSGVLNSVTTPFSAMLLIPAFIGMQTGFWMSDRMNPETFRKVTLVVLIVAGANLVRRGLFG